MNKLEQMNNIIEFNEIMKDIIVNHKVQEMKKYRQHGNTNCYEHCYEVAFECYKICKKLKLDYKSVTKAAMLHDMFLYDWHEPKNHKRLHGFHHAKTACENACKEFDLSSKEQDIIKNICGL